MPVYGIVDDFYSQYIDSYKKSQFSKDTSWDELVEEYQSLMDNGYANILMGKWEIAYQLKDSKELENITDNIYWDLRRHILKGDLSQTEKFVDQVSNKKDLEPISGKEYFGYLRETLKDCPKQSEEVCELKDKLNNLILRFSKY